VPLPSHRRAPPSSSSTMPPSPLHPPVLEPDRSRSFRPTPHRRSHHPVESPSSPHRAPVRRFCCHRRWVPWVQLKSGSGGSRPEGKWRGGARGASACARMASEAGYEQRCELSHGDRGGSVGKGQMGHGRCSAPFSHTGRASTPSPV
jgi:hypothetical protein